MVYQYLKRFSVLFLCNFLDLNLTQLFQSSSNFVASQQSIPLTARWCAPHDEYLKCLQLVNDTLKIPGGRIVVTDDQQLNTGKSFTIELACVYANHIYECVDLIYNNKADLARLSAEQLFALTTSQSPSHLSVNLVAAASSSVHTYIREYSALVVKTVSNIKTMDQTKNRRACLGNVSHVKSPGYTASWIMPMYHSQSRLLEKLSLSNCTNDLSIANQVFGSGACAPGYWATDPLFSSQYGTRLCASCAGGGSSCTPNNTNNDPLSCLSTDRGEMAFVSSLQIKRDFLGDNAKYKKTDYQLICQTDKADYDVSDYDKCNFGAIPEDGYIGKAVGTTGVPPAIYGKYIASLYSQFAVVSPTPSISFVADPNQVSVVKPMASVMPMYTFYTPSNYLAQFGNNTFNDAMVSSFPPCDKDSLRLCVDSVEEAEKCEDMQLAFKAAGLPINLKCLVGYSEDSCILALNKSNADLTMVSSHRAYDYVQSQTITPILSEYYVDYDYAIAVTTAKGKYLNDFTTKTFGVCSSGVDSFAGWEAPNTILQQLGLVARTCQLSESWNSILTSYGSCIPGINNASATLGRGADFPLTTNVALNLCKACGNSGTGTCKTPPEAQDANHQIYDTYYGDVGAFRCLSRKNGNLAFVRSSTISTAHILQLLGDPDFKDTTGWSLLCSDGKTSKPFNLDSVSSCNLGRVPNKWMVARNADHTQLIRWQNSWMFALGRARSDYNWLHTYIPYNLNANSHLLDLIFSNNTRQLSRINFDATTLQQYHSMAFPDPNYKSPFVCRGSASKFNFSIYLIVAHVIFIISCTVLNAS